MTEAYSPKIEPIEDDPHVIGWSERETGKTHKKLTQEGKEWIKQEWDNLINNKGEMDLAELRQAKNEYIDKLESISDDFRNKVKAGFNSRITNLEKENLLKEIENDPESSLGKLLKEGATQLGITENRMAGQLLKMKKEIETQTGGKHEAEILLGLTAAGMLYWIGRHKDELKEAGIRNLKHVNKRMMEPEPVVTPSSEPPPLPQQPEPVTEPVIEQTTETSQPIPDTGKEEETSGWRERFNKILLAGVGLAASIGIEEAIKKAWEKLHHTSERIDTETVVTTFKRRRKETLAAAVIAGMACCVCGYIVLFSRPAPNMPPVTETSTFVYIAPPIETATSLPTEEPTLEIFPTATVSSMPTTVLPTATELLPTPTATPGPVKSKIPTSGGEDPRVLYRAAEIAGVIGLTGVTAIEIARRKKKKKDGEIISIS